MRLRSSVAALGFAAIGLGASIASLIDYFGASPTFCAETGCATVRESAWSHPLGVPMPILGVAFFVAAIVLGFVEAPRLRRVLAVAGGLWALALIGLQAFQLGAWCKLCMIADPAALGYAVCVLAGARALRPAMPRALLVAPAVFATLGVLVLWTHDDQAPPAEARALPGTTTPGTPAPGTPAFVTAAQAPGEINVVEIVDFECPFCRRLQAQLTTAIAQLGRPVHLVRKMLPLAMHPHALPAALAYCCADAQGKGDAMAAVLFAAPPDELTADGCEKLAASVGCDLDQYRRDMSAAAARVADEMAQAQAAGIHALPTMFIGSERIVGAGKSTEQLTALLAAQ